MASIIRIILITSILLIVYATEYRKLNLHNQLKLNSIRRTKEGRDVQYMDNKTAVVYNDVIKNITRVNKVLEDLINNYEKIKKIYRSQEVLTNEYSSADDIEEGESPLIRANATFPTTNDFVATPLFYSEEINDEDDDDDVSEATSAPVSKKTDPTYQQKENTADDSEKSQSTEETEMTTTKQHSKSKTKPQEKTTSKEKKTTKEKKTKVKGISVTDKHVSITTPSEVTKTKVRGISVTDKHVSITTPSEITKTETKKKEKKDSKKDPKTETKAKSEEEQDYSSGEGSSSTMLNNSHEPVSTGSDEIFLDIDKSIDPGEVNNNASSLDKNNSKIEPYVKVKAVVHTEDFAPDTIWEDVKNKPVHLAKQGERVYTQYAALRSLTVLPQLQDPVKRSKMLPESLIKGVSIVKDHRTHSQESLEDEKTIAMEQFKTRILRKAYGDACLKVVVKKCYKACKRAYKDACRKYKCKGSFKNTFQLHSKRSCIKEFREKSSNKTNETDPQTEAMRAGFGDITANGYAAAACLPSQQINLRRMANETSVTSVGVKLNILRDRFERECQKVSANKCTIACRNASVETCTEDKCVESKLNRLKKECKRYCKWSYKNKKSEGSSKKKSKKKHSSCSSSGSSDSESSSSESDSSLSIPEDDKKDDDDKKDEPKSKEKPKHRKKKRVVRSEQDPIVTLDTPATREGIHIEENTKQTKEAKKRQKWRRHNKG